MLFASDENCLSGFVQIRIVGAAASARKRTEPKQPAAWMPRQEDWKQKLVSTDRLLQNLTADPHVVKAAVFVDSEDEWFTIQAACESVEYMGVAADSAGCDTARLHLLKTSLPWKAACVVRVG